MAWRTSTLHRILRNEVYIETAYYNKTYGAESMNRKKYSRRINTARRLRDKSEWIAVKVPAIIDETIFRLAQEMLRRNGRGSKMEFRTLSPKRFSSMRKLWIKLYW